MPQFRKNKAVTVQPDQILELLRSVAPKRLKFDEDTALYANAGKGVVDSLYLLKFIFLLEKNFGVTIPIEEINTENFATVKSLAAYLTRRLGKS